MTVMSIRPAYFVGNVMYYETHLSEIIEEYCVNKNQPELECNGKCHLSKEISSLDNNQTSESVANISVAFFPVYYQEIPQTNFTIVTTQQLISYFNYEFTYRSLMGTNIHKPPIV